jgi:hypothetical protein
MEEGEGREARIGKRDGDHLKEEGEEWKEGEGPPTGGRRARNGRGTLPRREEARRGVVRGGQLRKEGGWREGMNGSAGV